jgi:uncharacterized glyoxalase superfamily protein PhnB
MAAQVPESWRDKIVHSTLTLADGGRLFGNDSVPGVRLMVPSSTTGTPYLLSSYW